MRKVYNFLSIFLFTLLVANLNAQNCEYDQSSLLFDLDECKAIFGFPSQTEYDEFTAVADTFDGGTILSVVGGHLYRENGTVNMHSCTEGPNGSAAMCVGSLDACDYVADSDKAVRFDIKVETGDDGFGRLSGLSFYESAADMFNWLNGTSGPNNYPTKYAIRVSVNGATVYEEIDIETSSEYTLETFDFSDLPAFKVTNMTVFNFELLPYCTVDNGSTVNAWDLEDIKITANAVDNVNGGSLTFGDGSIDKEICVGNGAADNMNVSVSDMVGTSSTYFITDADTVILEYDIAFPYDFESTTSGSCLIWNISYNESIMGTDVGDNANDIIGCYDLSNAIVLTKIEVGSGVLSGGPFTFCVGDGEADNIGSGDINLTNNLGANGQWIITDDMGNILSLPNDYTDVDFDDSFDGTCQVWYLSYEDGISGLTIGDNISDLDGCYALSNSIEITKNERPTASITPTATVCAEDNGSMAVVGSGGDSPYTFAWSNGDTGSNISDLAAGEYTVTITDANGCTNTASATIDESTSPSITTTVDHTSCGEDDGSISASTVNGTSPYTYTWSNGMTGTSISNVAAGNYTVTVTDANGCTDTTSATIDDSEAPEVSASGNDTSCGEDNGSAMATTTGGQSPYTYVWTTGATSNSVSNLSPGNYRVTVTDANGCTDWTDVDIDDSSSPTVTTSPSDTSCGEDNGTATASATSGIAPYTFDWSNGDSGSSVSGLTAGSYTVTVTDDEGCTSTSTFDIEDSSSPTATASSTATTCGEDNGTADVSITNGTSPYTYAWSNGSTTASLNNLSAGSYTVTITDANDCTAVSSTTVDESNNITATATSEDTTCGEDNGSVSAVGTNGTAPYTFAWSTGATTASINNLSPGNYSVTITDALGCEDNTSATVDDSTSPVADASAMATVCGDDNGSASATASSGEAPYTFTWSNGMTGASISNVAAGNYTVTVTDANGCTDTTSTTIDDSTSPSITTTVDHTSCGEDDGSIEASTVNGTSPYTYTWSNGMTGASISNVAAGNYTVTVTDANGCTDTTSATINDSDSPEVSASGNDTSCGENNGSAMATTTGGLSPYTYVWTTGATSSSISNLAAGNYRVTVTDANGCTDWTDVDIDDSAAPMSSVSTNDTTCGEDNGTASATAISGVAPYTYLWSTGSNDENITGLSAGNYTVTVTDANGCESQASGSVSDSSSPNADASATATSCGLNNGMATVDVVDGVAPYTYLWSSAATTQMIMGLESADYSVTVTDANGCTDVAHVLVESSESPSIVVAASPTECGDDDGTITAVVFGGIEPYTYLWSTGSTSNMITGLSAGTYSVTITDAAGCTVNGSDTVDSSTSPVASVSTNDTECGEDNGAATATVTSGVAPYTYLWSTGSTSNMITGLSAGNYTVTVTDSNGCSSQASGSVSDSSSPNADASATATSCGLNNGMATVDVVDGVAPYTYLWSSAATTQMIMGLESADYSVTVTDANGCTDVAHVLVEASESPSIEVTASPTECGDEDGTVTATATSGIAPYTYLWSTGSTSSMITGLSAGTYSVTVTDAAGCTVNGSDTVDSSTSPVVSVSTNDTECGEDNGAATATVTSGVAPYTYLWSTGSTSNMITGLSAGNYTVTVTDANGCSSQASGSVSGSSSPNADASATATSCGQNNGMATVDVVDGVAPYTYLWSSAATSQMIMGLEPADYSVTVTDANGCTDVAHVLVEASESPSIEVTASPTECGEENGTVTATATSGIAPYTYLWSTGSTSNMITGLSAGTYSVTVTDAAGCTVNGSDTVDPSSAPTVTIDGENTSCGEDNGSATANPTMGTAPYVYLWSHGANTPNVDNLSAGVYTVTVTDSKGCTVSSAITIEDSATPTIGVTGTDTTCDENNGSATASATGGQSPYTFVWSTADNDTMIDGLEPGTYSVTVTDANGCTDETFISISESSRPNIYIGSSPEICGMMDGAVTTGVTSGGTAPYTYLWSNGSTLDTQSGLDGGTYTVTVTDALGCTASTFIEVGGSITPDGGVISVNGSTTVEFCQEGTMDMLANLLLNGEVGTNMDWIITDASGSILHILDDSGITEFDFEGQDLGTCFVYHLSYEDIENLNEGSNISEFTGCYDLSNSIEVIKYEVVEFSESSLTVDMDLCASDGTTEEPYDYSEFTADINNDPNCTTLSVVGGNLYRNNPNVNGHSCTEGVDGSVAMCVSSDIDCDYNPSSDRAILLDIEVQPAANGASRLTELSFFEKAPLTYDWINGDQGPNNYPTKFGVRVLKGSEVIFQQSGLTTLQDWNKRTFELEGAEFLVTETTVFTVQLLSYCVIGNGEAVTAWDIDNLSLVSECDNTIEAGTLTGGPYEICHDGISDFITDVTLDGAVGEVVKFVLVKEENNEIIAEFESLEAFSLFDFETVEDGVCNLYAISAGAGFTGAEVGNTLKLDFEGCYKLSNPVEITKMACGTVIGTYPNPTNSKVTLTNVHTMKGNKTISIYDAMGKNVRTFDVSEDIVVEEIDLSSYNPGIYIIQIVSTSGERSTRSVMKVR